MKAPVGRWERCGGGTSTVPQGGESQGPGPSSTAVQLERLRKGRPWESIWGCSAVNEALSNQLQSKPVQFPGALGLDIPFSSFCTAQIREEHAYCGSQGPPICLIPVGWGYSWRIARKVPLFELSADPGAEVASVRDCFISVWGMQTGFQIS